ncbi:aminotransferase class I/II-fold pyridoxal phosphate-dependent enzyme [Sphingomonas sp. LaA6.9]|uniref:aminotransferase class I/II-fold pyridoxal phosphate-dependent enzyme n=1 Tax=Sphingomonas sp. LaA6.9 TaxID=2919914 RepID=UPI001F501951|nr:aminotransferase class I/II-fold pyridoxal phosphate-dependent enzyme [Sphingomonas sp. LaA6.9]MCJ8159665.1 aminotransferase class I/II-fold pyridoxal phosphate-dependent enzyme [Sphingomonas sp. LaA6.9]
MAQTTIQDNDIAAWSTHGGRLAEAAIAFPDAPLPWIDLSTGINPHAWDASRAGPIDWRALPGESALNELEAAAAAHFGIMPDHVCAVPGSEMGLRLLASAGLPAPIRHVAPGYATHGALAAGGAITAAALLEEARRGGTILLANPNNPDGRLWDTATLIEAASRLAAASGVLIIDEAFADVDPSIGVWPSLPTALHRHVIVMRSFGKFFGLAGLRLGFVCAVPDRLSVVRETLGSWPVSAGAIAIGTAAYRDHAWIAAMRARLEAEAHSLDVLLRAHDLEVHGACPLFRLVETPDAHLLFTRLARQGILTRPFDHASGWLRIGLPSDAVARARLDHALRHG